MITTEADNDKRLTGVLNRCHSLYFLVKMKIYLFYLLLYIKHYMHRIRKRVQKVIDNICKNSPWA